MKILVCVKRVLDPQVKARVKADGSGVDLANAKMTMNPFCENALEEALRLREAGIDPKKVTMYGNSMDDEALLLASGRPVLVNADSELLAQRRLKSAQRITITKKQKKGD